MVALIVIGAVGVIVLGVRAVPPRPVSPAWSAPSVAPDLVVARVHGETVPWTAVEERLKAGAAMGRPAPSEAGAWREFVVAAIESLVGDVLTRHLMEAEGVIVTDTAIDEQIRALEQRLGGADELEAAMDQMDVSMSELRETQRRGLYYQALIERVVPVTEADIDAYLAQPGAAGLSRADAALRVREARAADVIPDLLADLRRDPGIWVIDPADL